MVTNIPAYSGLPYKTLSANYSTVFGHFIAEVVELIETSPFNSYTENKLKYFLRYITAGMVSLDAVSKGSLPLSPSQADVKASASTIPSPQKFPFFWLPRREKKVTETAISSSSILYQCG